MSAMTDTPKDGKAQFTEVGQDPTLDMALMRDPREIDDADLEALVGALRRERAFRGASFKKGEAALSTDDGDK